MFSMELMNIPSVCMVFFFFFSYAGAAPDPTSAAGALPMCAQVCLTSAFYTCNCTMLDFNCKLFPSDWNRDWAEVLCDERRMHLQHIFTKREIMHSKLLLPGFPKICAGHGILNMPDSDVHFQHRETYQYFFNFYTRHYDIIVDQKFVYDFK